MTITVYAYVADYLLFESGKNSFLVAHLTPAGMTGAQFTFDLDKYSVSGNHLSSNKVVVKRRNS